MTSRSMDLPTSSLPLFARAIIPPLGSIAIDFPPVRRPERQPDATAHDSEAPRDEAEHIPAELRDAMDATLHAMRGDFTADDLRVRLPRVVRDWLEPIEASKVALRKNCYGGWWQGLVASGAIVRTGRRAKSIRRQARGRILDVWTRPAFPST